MEREKQWRWLRQQKLEEVRLEFTRAFWHSFFFERNKYGDVVPRTFVSSGTTVHLN